MNHPFDKSLNPTHNDFCNLARQLMHFDEVPVIEEFINSTAGGYFQYEQVANKLKEVLPNFNRYEITNYTKGLINEDQTIVNELAHFIKYHQDFILDKQSLATNYN